MKKLISAKKPRPHPGIYLQRNRGRNPKNHLVGYEGKEYLAFEVVSLKEPGHNTGKTIRLNISKKIQVFGRVNSNTLFIIFISSSNVNMLYF